MANLEYNPVMNKSHHKIRVWILGLLPIAVLAAIIFGILKAGLPFFGAGGPPLEELTFNRITLQQGKIIAEVQNTGHEELTIPQVAVNEAYVYHSIEPSSVIPRLGKATITINYHWIEEEPLVIMAVSSIGTTFETDVPVALETPAPNATAFGMFALIGLFVGVIPVLLGLLWKPFLAKTNEKTYKFFLSLTVGLLVFLGIDAIEESLDIALRLPGVWQGVAVITLGIFSSIFTIVLINQKFIGSAKKTTSFSSKMSIAYMIAIGIGMHNLGEGLAIGAAYTLGEVALGASLILGFMIHNLTEGLAIVAPISREEKSSPKLVSHLIFMGLIAGGPAIIGSWIGGFVYSSIWSLVFLSVGAGAVFQVIYEIVKMMAKKDKSFFADLPGGLGILCGMLIMFITGLFVIG